MRCLTLADALRERGARCTFICRAHPGHLLDLIAQRGHHAVALCSRSNVTVPVPEDSAYTDWLGTDGLTDAHETREALGIQSVDWLVVDHYALDRRWEQILRPHCQKLMVMDDLADRHHDCDLLLDPNLGRSTQDYAAFIHADTATFIGPQYALLRPEFAQLRQQSLSRRALPQLKHLLITMGGVDKNNATGQVLQALASCHLPTDLRITVVMGPQAPSLEAVQQQAAIFPRPTQVLVGVSDMAQRMADSDLCIGAAGGTSWERCCLGLPTLVLVLADNQLPGAKALEKAGAALLLTSAQEFPPVWARFLSGSAMAQQKNMSQAAAAISDGLGVERIVSTMVAECPHA